MFCLSSFMNSKGFVTCFVWNHKYYEKFAPPKMGGCLWEFYHTCRFIYISPSSDHLLLTLNLIFYSKHVWGCLMMSGVRLLHFSKDWWKFIQSHQYYTGWPPKNGTVDTVDFSGLCSDQQLSFFTLLNRASFSHYNNTKIIKLVENFLFY